MPEALVVTEPELVAYGEAVGRSLSPGAVVLFSGELGAGKTALVRAIARGLGAEAAVTSPTYALVNRYAGPRGPIYHVDCYRLRVPDEASDLDWEGMAAGAALLIEWPERAGAWLPAADRRYRLSHTPDPGRRMLEQS